MGQDVEERPAITINKYELEAVNQFVYQRSNITDNLSLEAEISSHISMIYLGYGNIESPIPKSPYVSRFQVCSHCSDNVNLADSGMSTEYKMGGSPKI